jgi:ADP-heptose:LPS heptosyltransferase
MNIIFQINGGIGKCVLATAVCEAIKKEYPDSTLIVVSGYSDVFLNNPFVDRTYTFGSMSYFYEQYIEDKEIKIFAHDPYLETSHIRQDEHLIETWCKLFNVPYNEEQPKIYLTDREKKFFSTKYTSDKPILLLQTNGGALSDLKYSWARDIPIVVVQEIINAFKDEYNIVHIKREDQIGYEGTVPITDTFRSLAVLIQNSDKRLLIDSFAQHTAAAMNKPSTVCWIVNSPNVFGYSLHSNIIANPFTIKPELRNSYFSKFNITGDLIEFPYNVESEIFNTKEIIESLKNQP